MNQFPKAKLLILFHMLFIFGSSAFVFAGELKGVVVEKATQDPLSGATVVIVGRLTQTTTGNDGRFSIPDVPVGEYGIKASMIGYETTRIDRVKVGEEGPTEVTIELDKDHIVLEEIIVTPGRFTLMRKEPTVRYKPYNSMFRELKLKE